MDACSKDLSSINESHCFSGSAENIQLQPNKTQFNGFRVYPIKIGIFGCSHGDIAILEKVMTEMRDRGVSKVIANGDFVTFLGLEGLEDSLKTIHSLFPEESEYERNKENVYIMPGNWDHTTIDPKNANEAMKKYGQLLTEDYDSFGRVCINGKQIQVAHFPQHPLPRKYLPPDQYLYSPAWGQAHFFGTMSKQMSDLSYLDLNIVGHSHIHTHFYDTTSKVLTYCPGGLTDRKKEEEKKGFGIYNTESGVVTTYSVEKYDNDEFDIKEMSSYSDHIHGACDDYNDFFNIKDPRICGLDYRKVSECASKIKFFERSFLTAISPVPQREIPRVAAVNLELSVA